MFEKLGYRMSTTALLWRIPEELVATFADMVTAGGDDPIFHSAFIRSQAEMVEAARDVAAGYRSGQRLWLCYPVKGAQPRSDLSRDVGWEPIHALNLLDVMQVAIDETWSALRFRYRDGIRSITRSSPTGARAKS